MGVRTTANDVSMHRRLVVQTMTSALKSVFGPGYDREPQLQNLRVTTTFPLQKVDYPSVVVEYEPARVRNMGVGHEEWFPDENMVMRKWHHRLFEGTVNFNVFALSPLDKDILSDALTEVISFGRLDAALLPFFTTIYGAPTDPVKLLFTQVLLNTDEITFGGDSQSIAPWSPEDLLVYETSQSLEIHGSFYNTLPNDTWGYVTRAQAEPYPQGEQDVTIEFGGTQTLPYPDPSTVWTNPREFADADTVVGTTGLPDYYGRGPYGSGPYG